MLDFSRSGAAGVSGGPDAASQMAVLVVDDEETVRNLLSLIVTRAGARADLADSAGAARELLAKRRYAAALLDKNLPDATGLQLMAFIKEHSPKTECLIVTGYASMESAIEAVRLGAFDYIVKPFDVLAVQHRVKLAIERQRLGAELETALAALQKQSAQLQESREELRRAYLESVMRLSIAVEYRDEGAGPHVSRMSRYAAILARAVEAQEGFVEQLALAAPLHDVGNVGVPDAILRKPGPLSAEERAAMQEHVTIGARILDGASSDVLSLAREVVLAHHERWDGTGYPGRKRGEDIPLSGRIVAICDAWDAMTTERVYRPARSVEAALEEIQRGSGTQFDPTLVKALVDSRRQFEAVLADST